MTRTPGGRFLISENCARFFPLRSFRFKEQNSSHASESECWFAGFVSSLIRLDCVLAVKQWGLGTRLCSQAFLCPEFVITCSEAEGVGLVYSIT